MTTREALKMVEEFAERTAKYNRAKEEKLANEKGLQDIFTNYYWGRRAALEMIVDYIKELNEVIEPWEE